MNNPHTEPDTAQKQASQHSFPRWFLRAGIIAGFIVGAILYALFGVGGLVLLSFYVGSDTDRISFVTENLLSFLIIGAVVVQAIIYFIQWRAMQGTLREMRLSRELENRAWIGVKVIDIENRADGGVNFNGTYVNSGNSPANVTVEVRGEYLQQPPPDDFQFPPYETKGSRLVLFPHMEYNSLMAVLPGVPMVVDGSQGAWYLYGRLKYEDIFGHAHVTRFAYCPVEVEGIGGAPPGKKHITLQVSETHNVFD
ncbi:MAG TPA: phage holin family protein [Pyrinomonadaceae bacterium]|nr:phage holin family protein [Pyrinomonadaceae bacterium]